MTQPNTVNHIKDFLDAAQKITGVKSETIFTVCTTIFVFGAGIITNAILNYLKERRERKKYKNTVQLLLTNLSDVCKRQYRITSKDIEDFSLLDNKVIAIKVQIYSPLQFLNKMDYSLFIKYYVTGCYLIGRKKQIRLKAKATTKIFQIIGYCNSLESGYEKGFNFFIDHMKPMQEMYVKNILILERFGKHLSSLVEILMNQTT